MLRPRWILLLAVSLLPALAFAASPAAPEWRSWNEGLRQAAATGRPVLVDVYTSWCGWCRRMDRDVYSRDDVAHYLRDRYVTVRLDAESPEAAEYLGHRYTSAQIAQHFQVSGYPTTIFLRASGEHMANVPGYVEGDRFLLLLRYVAEGHADRNEPFTEFEKQQTAPRAAH